MKDGWKEGRKKLGKRGRMGGTEGRRKGEKLTNINTLRK